MSVRIQGLKELRRDLTSLRTDRRKHPSPERGDWVFVASKPAYRARPEFRKVTDGRQQQRSSADTSALEAKADSIAQKALGDIERLARRHGFR